MAGLKQRGGGPQKAGSIALMQARVMGRCEDHDADDWLAQRVHRIADGREVSYLASAFAGGAAEDWGFDLSGARPLRKGEFDRLITAGVPMRFAAELNAAGDVLAAQVDLSRDGLRFALGGPTGRLLLLVRDGSGAVVDVIAFTLDQPREVASLINGGDGVLGELRLPHPGEVGRVAMFETPMDWLRAGGNGLCVYDWRRAVGLLRQLGEAVTLEAPPALAAVVRAKLERGGLPLVASAVASDAKLSLAERIGRERG